MKTRALCLVVFVLASAGCDFLAPVVAPQNAGGSVESDCRTAPLCRRLQSPPAAPEAPLVGLDDELTCGVRERRTLDVTSDIGFDAGELRCVDLVLVVTGTPADVRRLELTGDVLTNTTIQMVSEGPAVDLHVTVHRLEASELAMEGPVTATLDRVRVSNALFSLGSFVGSVAPSVVIVDSTLQSVSIDAPREVWFRDVDGTGLALAVQSLVLDRGQVEESTIEAASLTMLEANVTSSRLSVGRMTVASGAMQDIHIAHCVSVRLSSTGLLRSFIARCEEPLDVRDVAFVDSVIEADILGTGGALRQTVFGGQSARLEDGIIEDTAFCGTQRVQAASLSCVRCEPSAPPDICAVVQQPVGFCPGICTSRCSVSREPTIAPEECMP